MLKVYTSLQKRLFNRFCDRHGLQFSCLAEYLGALKQFFSEGEKMPEHVEPELEFKTLEFATWPECVAYWAEANESLKLSDNSRCDFEKGEANSAYHETACMWKYFRKAKPKAKPKAHKILRVHIYDMDGCIVDSSHRYRTVTDENGTRIDLAHWRENEYRAMEDQLLPLASQYKADLLDPHCFVIIATAREMNEPDWQFVNEVLGMPDHFISRPKGSAISGKTLKINGLAKFFNLNNFKSAEFVFFEDNIQYLQAVCNRFGIRGVYVPSVQGH